MFLNGARPECEFVVRNMDIYIWMFGNFEYLYIFSIYLLEAKMIARSNSLNSIRAASVGRRHRLRRFIKIHLLAWRRDGHFKQK